MEKQTIVVDFDGVVHASRYQVKDVTTIPNIPVGGAFQALQDYGDHFHVAIYGSRSSSKKGIDAMKKWFLRHGWPQNRLGDPANLMFPTNKPAAVMTIDDRAFCFRGKFPDVDFIKKFKPWNKR